MSTRKLALYEDATQAWGLIEADALMLLAKLPDACVDADRDRSAVWDRLRWRSLGRRGDRAGG